MNGAEDMIVDHNMVVAQVFRRLGKRLDRPCIAAKFGLRINHTSFHRPFPLSRCEVLAGYGPFASGSKAATQIPSHKFSPRHGRRLPGAMMIANRKRSKRSSACRLESFSRLRGLLRPRGSFPTCRLGEGPPSLLQP